MKLIDAYFAKDKKPKVGNSSSECVAVAEIRSSDGKIAIFHALLTEEQWAYHNKVGAIMFDAAKALAGKSGLPAHFFAGRPVIDETAKKIYEPGKAARDIVDAVAPPPKEATNELAIPADSVDR
jgi:hypothetical protein